jgi:hypothetical protein
MDGNTVIQLKCRSHFRSRSESDNPNLVAVPDERSGEIADAGTDAAMPSWRILVAQETNS